MGVSNTTCLACSERRLTRQRTRRSRRYSRSWGKIALWSRGVAVLRKERSHYQVLWILHRWLTEIIQRSRKLTLPLRKSLQTMMEDFRHRLIIGRCRRSLRSNNCHRLRPRVPTSYPVQYLAPIRTWWAREENLTPFMKRNLLKKAISKTTKWVSK